MKRYLLLLFIFSFLQINIKAQNVPSTFTLEGKINVAEGNIILIPVGLDFFHPGFNSDHEAKVVNGNFIFKDSIYYPYPFRLRFESKLDSKGYLSGIFFIDPGIQHIVCNKDSIRKTPDLENNTMREFKVLTSTQLTQQEINIKVHQKETVYYYNILIPIRIHM